VLLSSTYLEKANYYHSFLPGKSELLSFSRIRIRVRLEGCERVVNVRRDNVLSDEDG
jgi:hypothetical protein